jgi:hypothetical protein
MFTVTPIMTDGQVEEDPLHDLHARQILILCIFTCGPPKIHCLRSSCWQRRDTSPLHCGYLSDYPQLLRHLWTDAAVHDETCRGVHWNTLRTFWAHIINVHFQLKLTNWMIPDTCWYGCFFLSRYVELMPKLCPQLADTLCIHVCKIWIWSILQIFYTLPIFG